VRPSRRVNLGSSPNCRPHSSRQAPTTAPERVFTATTTAIPARSRPHPALPASSGPPAPRRRCRLPRAFGHGKMHRNPPPPRENEMPTESKHPETIVLHAGYRSDPRPMPSPCRSTRRRAISSATASMRPICSRSKEFGQHLLPHHEPDERTCSNSGSPRLRRRGLRHWRSAPARQASMFWRQQHRAGRRQFRQLDRPLWRLTWNLFLTR